MGRFGYDPAVLDRFPGIRAGVVHATSLANRASTEALRAVFAQEHRQVLTRIGDTPLSEIPTLAAWRRAFSTFGVAPTQYRNAAESLLRRLTKYGDIPSINTLVDIANLVSIRHGLPIAVFDQWTVTGATTVRFANGNEHFTDLGGNPSTPEAGEVIFVDDALLVSARRWCWRQSAQSAAGPDTTEALITIEGQHVSAEADSRRATEDLVTLMETHQADARLHVVHLSDDSPVFEFE